MVRLLRPLAALLLVLLVAAPALAWTEFRLDGLQRGKRYTLTVSEGGKFGSWKQSGVGDLKVTPKQVSFTAKGNKAVLFAVLRVKADAVLGNLNPYKGVRGQVQAGSYQGYLEDGVWFIDFPGAPLTCTANPSCVTDKCPPGQKCFSWQGKFYCCWLDPGRP
ncbi:MAG: hypothetical protein KQH53_17700 [Desulfarculaceae bacterium]|nr:hypothetical protein [Desulfarculaceae bacterium]